MQVDRHLGDPLLSGLGAPMIGGETETPPDRRLHTRTIEDFAFDFGRRHRLGAHRLDSELLRVVGIQVARGAEKFAGEKQKTFFGARQARPAPSKFRPFLVLPIPTHDR